MPLRTQQRIHTDEPQRHSITAASDILQIVVQCHLGEPEATEESEKPSGNMPNAMSCAGVTHISAGVHSGYQMLKGDICLRHMHTLRSSPGDKKATCHCDC